jgi:hypothetical protein
VTRPRPGSRPSGGIARPGGGARERRAQRCAGAAESACGRVPGAFRMPAQASGRWTEWYPRPQCCSLITQLLNIVQAVTWFLQPSAGLSHVPGPEFVTVLSSEGKYDTVPPAQGGQQQSVPGVFAMRSQNSR